MGPRGPDGVWGAVDEGVPPREHTQPAPRPAGRGLHDAHLPHSISSASAQGLLCVSFFFQAGVFIAFPCLTSEWELGGGVWTDREDGPAGQEVGERHRQGGDPKPFTFPTGHTGGHCPASSGVRVRVGDLSSGY